MARTLNESLSRDSTPITYYRDRLKELDRPVFDVYRTKNEQVLATLDTRSEAEEYVTDNDYDPERVKVRENVSSLVSDENRTEVADLRKIRDAVIAGAKRGEFERPWQYFAVLLPVRSVGVQGDVRSYGETLVVRAVSCEDAMTAQPARFPPEFLERLSARLSNELKEKINRVAYDFTFKPPGTIEWE